eukprot:3038275-Pyramimonas_sp.AAC.1
MPPWLLQHHGTLATPSGLPRGAHGAGRRMGDQAHPRRPPCPRGVRWDHAYELCPKGRPP